MIYNVIDLFAGAGGLSLGFKQTGQVKIIAAAENNPNARKTCTLKNHNNIVFLIDGFNNVCCHLYDSED